MADGCDLRIAVHGKGAGWCSPKPHLSDSG
jgi:hypothetical protein